MLNVYCLLLYLLSRRDQRSHGIYTNIIQTEIFNNENCCGMPKLELGDLKSVEELMKKNIPNLVKAVKEGYDIDQLSMIREVCKVPLIASGGAGEKEHFKKVFKISNVDGALAASVFHDNKISIEKLKNYLKEQKIEVRK